MAELQTEKIVNHEFLGGSRIPDEDELIADAEAYDEAVKTEEAAAAALAEKLARAEALAKRLGTVAETVTEDESDNDNAGLITGNKTSEEIAADNATKYLINDGTIVRVTYENGTSFILNYNRFAVSVDGQTIEALSYLQTK